MTIHEKEQKERSLDHSYADFGHLASRACFSAFTSFSLLSSSSTCFALASLRSKVSSVLDHPLRVFLNGPRLCLCHSLCLCLYIRLCFQHFLVISNLLCLSSEPLSLSRPLSVLLSRPRPLLCQRVFVHRLPLLCQPPEERCHNLSGFSQQQQQQQQQLVITYLDSVNNNKNNNNNLSSCIWIQPTRRTTTTTCHQVSGFISTTTTLRRPVPSSSD